MQARILVIDDEEGIRFTFESFLRKEGHEVQTVADYHSALNAIARKRYDLVFVDVILGDHTGVEILGEIKENGMGCPVIMITGKPSIDTAADSVRLGAFDYLSKPIEKETLLRATRLALDHKGLADEKKKIQAENDRYRKHMEAIFRSVSDGIITVDKGMRVIEVNDAIRNTCGTRPETCIGNYFDDINFKCSRSCRSILAGTLKNQVAERESRVECRTSDRVQQVAEVSSSPLMDQNNNPIGAVLVIRDVTRINDLERELRERHRFYNIVGKSQRMQEIYRLIEDLAYTDTTVLITGESGTGKELISKALHYSGPRAFKPMITVNCSALAENLLESELFGHVKGAFTGALRDKVGRFQAAHEGTIFLDEIGDISPVIQLKLLRVLQEKEFERVGESTPIKVDARIIASTNQPLKEKVKQGEFREDLYYRLKVVEILLPPLRERLEDVPLFVKHFCYKFNKNFKRDIEGITDDVLNVFMRYPWPGNVRELEHAIEHAFVLCRGSNITLDHIPMEIKEPATGREPRAERSNLKTAQQILLTLEKTAWNKARAARMLGVSRQTLYRKIKEFDIEKNSIV